MVFAWSPNCQLSISSNVLYNWPAWTVSFRKCAANCSEMTANTKRPFFNHIYSLLYSLGGSAVFGAWRLSFDLSFFDRFCDELSLFCPRLIFLKIFYVYKETHDFHLPFIFGLFRPFCWRVGRWRAAVSPPVSFAVLLAALIRLGATSFAPLRISSTSSSMSLTGRARSTCNCFRFGEVLLALSCKGHFWK